MAAASASPEGGQRRPLATAGAWTLLQIVGITAFTTYPFAAMVQQLSDISPTRYSPCSERNCTFLKVIGDGHVPSTSDSWRNPFKTIRNGEIPTDTMPGSFVAPLCPNMTKHQMQRLCADAGRPLPEEFATLGLASVEVVNTLRGAPSKVVYLIGIAGWYFFKVVHDCLLVLDYPEMLTLKLGIVSVSFQLLATAAAFVWCVGAAGLFMAPVVDGTCACYYRLGTLDTGLSIATPTVLAYLATTKAVAVLRSFLSGDYVYAVQYDVPYRFVAQSTRSPLGSLLVDRLGGNSDVKPRNISFYQLRELRLFFLWLVVALGYAHVVVVASIGPICVRGFEWLLTFTQDHHYRPVWFLCMLTFFIALLMALPLLQIHDDIRWLFDFDTMSWSRTAHRYSTFRRLFHVGRTVSRDVCFVFSAALLSKLLMDILLQHEVPFESTHALVVFGAAVVFGICAGSFVLWKQRFDVVEAIDVKAHVPRYPQDFIWTAQQSEYDLRQEVELAQAFLGRYPEPSDPDELDKWTRLWNSELHWPDYNWFTERCTRLPRPPSDDSSADDDHDDEDDKSRLLRRVRDHQM